MQDRLWQRHGAALVLRKALLPQLPQGPDEWLLQGEALLEKPNTIRIHLRSSSRSGGYGSMLTCFTHHDFIKCQALICSDLIKRWAACSTSRWRRSCCNWASLATLPSSSWAPTSPSLTRWVSAAAGVLKELRAHGSAGSMVVSLPAQTCALVRDTCLEHKTGRPACFSRKAGPPCAVAYCLPTACHCATRRTALQLPVPDNFDANPR